MRQLQDKEIATLVVYGCSAENWKEVLVDENFTADFIQNVHFSGNITLGIFDKVVELPGGVRKHTGIFNCHLHNCSVGNNVYINKINNYIAGYDIGEDAYIENTDCIVAEKGSLFGNGTLVACMIESGGREISIFNDLSAPLAYIMTFYRHDKTLVQALEKSIKEHIEKLIPEKGTIGKCSKIVNCGSIKNVCIGDYSRVEGALLLDNGFIVSNGAAPVVVGAGVMANDFIIQSGSSVTDAAMLTRCFVGQGCIISKQFSAIDSVFFANCQGMHGEAVSVFAGPYTVSHHKSTLMLTSLYSFMNAGSGTNFSNHMYKLGPVHQGVTERGVKTSSSSYIMWPARIGAFSAVLGRHKGNPDIQHLPFSYLMENNGESNLLPGINLHSAGTIRDVQKWPKRDLRKGEKIDPVCFDFLSPYSISKAMKGIEILKDLLVNMDPEANFVWYQNCKIKRSSVRKGIELYEMAIDSFIAQTVVNTAETQNSNVTSGAGEWVDLAGLMAPKNETDALCERIAGGEIPVETIQQELLQLFKNYRAFSFNFVKSLVESRYKKSFDKLTEKDKNDILKKGKAAETAFNDLILRDARKEFSSTSKTGFGIDGDDAVRDADFEATRGTFDDHPFVVERKKLIN